MPIFIENGSGWSVSAQFHSVPTCLPEHQKIKMKNGMFIKEAQICHESACGDGILDKVKEDCDDGNADDQDDCLNSCRRAVCGDGVVWSGQEECDDGDNDDDDACTTQCRDAFCGDRHGFYCEDHELHQAGRWSVPAVTILTAHGLELGAHRKSPNQYVFSVTFLRRLCNFCAMHPGSLKTGLLDSPDDLLVV